jgi:hypothetical protein
MTDLKRHVAEIILMRYEEAGVFDPYYDKEPLPVELEISEEIINTVLDAAIEACRNVSGGWYNPDNPEERYIEAIEALKEKDPSSEGS